MSRLDTIVEGIDIVENTDRDGNNSDLAIPLSLVVNKIGVRTTI